MSHDDGKGLYAAAPCRDGCDGAVATAAVFLVGQVTSAEVVEDFQGASDELIAETDHNLQLLGMLRVIRSDSNDFHDGDSDALPKIRQGLTQVRERLLNPAEGVEIEEGGEADALASALRHLDRLERVGRGAERPEHG